MGPESIRTHGEMAIAQAQMGQRQTDIGYKIGACLWFVLATGAALISLRNGSQNVSSEEFWGLQICAVVISIVVSVLIQRSSAKRYERQLSEIRHEKDAHKQRQLDEFMKSKKS